MQDDGVTEIPTFRIQRLLHAQRPAMLALHQHRRLGTALETEFQ
jgi:hypothetical protein